MTKRDFDTRTKENWGRGRMASDERFVYRERRRKRLTSCGAFVAPDYPQDPLVVRERKRTTRGRIVDRGSSWYAVARWRATHGRPMIS